MQKIINKMLIVTLFFSVITASFAGGLEDKTNKIVYEKELDFKNVPLADVLSIISKTSGVTIVPDSEVGALSIDLYFGRGQSLGEIIRTLKVTHKLTSRELNSVIILGKDLKNETQLEGSVSGKIISKKTGEGIDGIKVYLVGEKEKVTTSAVGGFFLLKNVDAGTYIIKAEGAKFKANGAIIEVKAGGLTQDIALSYTEEALDEMNQSKSSSNNESKIGKVTSAEGNDTLTEKVQLKHAFANEVKTVIESVVGKSIEVTAVEKQNLVVLKGEEGNIQTAKNLIAEIDKPIKQVRITAQVLQLTGSLADDLGINWGYASSKTMIGGAASSTGNLLADSGTLFGAPGGILKLASTLSSAGDIISASVKMLQTTKDAEVSSRPSVVTLNGDSAELNVTEDRYIGVIEKVDDKGNITKEPKYKDAGTILSVKATIRDGGNEKDTIILDISSEVSSFLDNTLGNGASQKNRVKNRVSVQDGGTIFIGGLKRTDTINNISKVPFLGDIPVFGKLFQSQNVTNDTKDIFIQIKAEIVTAENANDEISSEGFKKSSSDVPKAIYNRN